MYVSICNNVIEIFLFSYNKVAIKLLFELGKFQAVNVSFALFNELIGLELRSRVLKCSNKNVFFVKREFVSKQTAGLTG